MKEGIKVIPNYGQVIPIKSNQRYTLNDNSALIKEILDNSLVGNVWYFDRWGNRCNPNSKNDELPLRYWVDGEYYIEIKNYDINQDNLLDLIVYRYEIIREGYQLTKGSLTNNLAYADIRDCLDAARWTIFNYKDQLDYYFDSPDLDTNSGSEQTVFNYIDGKMSIDPNIEIDLIPLEYLDRYLIDDITIKRERPNNKPDYIDINFEDHPFRYENWNSTSLKF